MRVYSIHIRRHGPDLDCDFLAIKEGFSWPAFFLNALWALWHHHWLLAVVMIVVPTAIVNIMQLIGVTFVTGLVLCASWIMAVGASANDMRRYLLGRAGFVEAGSVFGQTSDEALYSYLKESSMEL